MNDILVIAKGSLNEHENELDKILEKLDKKPRNKSKKFDFAKNTIEWLGFKITPQGTTPLITKTEAIMKLEHPKTLKQLRSFMGSIHHLIKIMPKLAELTEPLRPFLKKQDNKNKRLNWNTWKYIQPQASI